MSDTIEFQTDVDASRPADWHSPNLWAAIVRRKWLLPVSILLALVIGYLYYAKKEPVFESVARILVTRITPVPIQQDQSAPNRDTSANLTTQAMLIQSPLVVGPAIEGTKPEKRDRTVENLVEKIEQETGKRIEQEAQTAKGTVQDDLRALKSLSGLRDPIVRVIQWLTVEQAGLDSDVLELTYRGGHDEDCRLILDAVVTSYQLFLKNTRHSNTQETIDLIEKARRDLTEDLTKIETDYQSFRRDNGHLLFKSADGQNMHQARQASIELARSEVLVQRSQVKAQLDSLREAIDKGADRDALILLIEKTDSTTQAIAKSDETIKSIRLTSPEGIALERKIDLLDRRIEQIQRKVTQAESDISQSERYLQQTQANMTEIQLKLEKLDETQKLIKQAEKSVRQFERDVQYVDARLTTVEELAKRLEDPNAESAAVDRELLPLLQEEQRLVDRFGADHPDVISVRKRIELTRSVISETQIEERRRKVADERRTLGDDRIKLQEDLAAAKEEIASQTAEYESLEASRPKFDQQLATLRTEFANLEAERDRFKDERTKLREESDGLDADRTAAEMELAKIEKERAIAAEAMRAAADAERSEVLRNSDGDLLNVYLGSLQQQITTLETKARELDKLFEDEQQKAKGLEALEVADKSFQNAMSRKQQLFDLVIERLEKVSLTEDLGGYDATVVSHAGPGRQVEPNFLKVTLLAIFLGSACGCILAYAIDLADKRYRSPEDIQSGLFLNVLGHVPLIPLDEMAAEITDKSIDPIVCAYHKPTSMLAECYRTVRTALFFGNRRDSLKVLQVTSPTPGDGKSSLASNLAVSIAQSGKKVLLIDADLRKPRVHKILGLQQEPGLSSVIERQCDFASALQTCRVKNLFILTSGPQPDNPAEMLSSHRFARLIEKLRDVMDYVILDTPPVLSVTDPCNVAPRVDGVIMVLTLTAKTRVNAKRTKELLDSVGAATLGIVVNRIASKTGFNYGGVGYSYNYRGYRYEGYGNGYGSYGDESDSTNGSSNAHANGNGSSNGNGNGHTNIHSSSQQIRIGPRETNDSIDDSI